MNKFRAACLYGEVVLCKSDFGFARVAILRYQITGIARKHYVIYLSLSTFGKTYHFPGVGKMIGNFFSGIFA